MPDLQDTVTVHPETVTKANEHATEMTRERERAKDRERKREWRRRRKVTAPSPVKSTKVDERVWSKALELAGGDVLRLDVQAPDVVVVMNHSKRRPAGERIELTGYEQLAAEQAQERAREPKPRHRKAKKRATKRQYHAPQWWDQFGTAGRRECPKCGAAFTTNRFLAAHYWRSHNRRLVDDYPDPTSATTYRKVHPAPETAAGDVAGDEDPPVAGQTPEG